jgi:hypothetical protein
LTGSLPSPQTRLDIDRTTRTVAFISSLGRDYICEKLWLVYVQLIGKVNTAIENDVENLQKITYLISFDPGVQKFLQGNVAGTVQPDSFWRPRCISAACSSRSWENPSACI